MEARDDQPNGRGDSPMKPMTPVHPYTTSVTEPTPVEALEMKVVELLRTSQVPDSARDSSIAFELKHSSAVVQFARLLARQRNLPVDVCAAGAVLHDIFVIVSGSYTDHA